MLLHSTGSKYFNIYLRKKAISKSMKLNQYGLFKNKKKIKTLTERSIFNILEEKYILPSRR